MCLGITITFIIAIVIVIVAWYWYILCDSVNKFCITRVIGLNSVKCVRIIYVDVSVNVSIVVGIGNSLLFVVVAVDTYVVGIGDLWCSASLLRWQFIIIVFVVVVVEN